MKIHDLHFSFADTVVFQGLNLEIDNYRTTAIMAPSGCGKTTLLRLIAGLLSPDKGYIDTENQTVGIMFQEPRLFAQLTVLQNVMLVIKQKHDKKERALELLQAFDVAQAADKYPDELSGGMAKRVSLARVIAYDTDILLLDEPFSALDTQTKQAVMEQVKRFTKDKTIVFITHDQSEAQQFADKILILPQKDA